MKNKIEKDSFITEIEEDLKNDNLKKLWDKYGVYLIASMASILLITIVIEVYSYFKIKSNQALVNQYSQALNLEKSGNYVQSLLVYADLSNKGEFISELALVEEVNLLIAQKNIKAATAKLKEIINNEDVGQEVKNVSTILLVSINFNEMNSQEVKSTLATIFAKRNPWAEIGYEFLAASYLKEGNEEEAIKIFEKIESESINPGVKSRASDMLSVLR